MSINVNDLWIGDKLVLKKSKRIGTYAGQSSDQKIRIKIGDKIVKTTISNVELYVDKPEPIEIRFDDDFDKIEEHSIKDSIDLHIEKLAPHLKNTIPARILDFQIKAFQDFLLSAILQRRKHITIIHGKGEGILKQEVQYILSKEPSVSLIQNINQGGATLAWLKT